VASTAWQVGSSTRTLSCRESTKGDEEESGEESRANTHKESARRDQGVE